MLIVFLSCSLQILLHYTSSVFPGKIPLWGTLDSRGQVKVAFRTHAFVGPCHCPKGPLELVC